MKKFKSRSEAVRTRMREKFLGRLSDGVSVAEALRELEQQDGAPSRATVYAWAKEWQARRSPEPGWTLATDRTGRPDLVLRLQGARHRHYEVLRGRPSSAPLPLTHDEAAWCVRLATAAPKLLTVSDDSTDPARDPLVNLWEWVLRYELAEDDAETVREYDRQIACAWADGGPYLAPGSGLAFWSLDTQGVP